MLSQTTAWETQILLYDYIFSSMASLTASHLKMADTKILDLWYLAVLTK